MKIGFIGFGNMAMAIAGGMIRYGGYAAQDFIVSAQDLEKLKPRAEQLGVHYTTDNTRVAKGADILFLAVKPYLLAKVIGEIREAVRPETIVVSVAAGVELNDIEADFLKPVKLIRTLPNTPALVGEGMTLYNANDNVSAEDEATVLELLGSFGICEKIEEDKFAGAGSMTGCSPAFIYMLMEAMADAAVLEGLKRDKAYVLAAQTVKGAAQMLLSTGLHPGELKDMVTSPGGTTIEGVRTLERLGFRSAMMEAIIAAAEKTGKK